MPNQEKQEPQTNILKDLLETNPYLKGANKAAEKKGAADFEEASMQVGGQQAITSLLQQLQQQLQQLASAPVPTGERMGLIPSLTSGQGVSRPEIQRPLAEVYGPGTAVQLMKMAQEQEKDQRQIPKENLEMLNQLVKFAKDTGNRELLGVVTEMSKGMSASPTGGKPQLGPEAIAKGRTIPDIVSMDKIGEVGEGTGISREGFYETDPLTGELTPQAEARRIEIREKIGAETKALTKQQVDLSEKETNFARVFNSFERAMAQLKGGIEEDAAGSLMKGIWGDLRILAKRPGVSRAASYDAQMKETALSLNNVLTGQNRVIKGVVQMILQTFPTRKAPPDMIAQLFTQSMENAYGIMKAFEKAGLTPERLQQMSDKELNSLNIQGLLASTELTPEEISEREQFVQRLLDTPAAPTRTIKVQDKKIGEKLRTLDEQLAEIDRQLAEGGK